MKQYPKILYFDQATIGDQCYAFDKLDGSNVRFEFSRKRGWYKFGTRNTMIDLEGHPFSDAIPIFLNKYGDDLGKIFTDKKEYRSIENFVVFGEYFGVNSFAGYHEPEDKKDIIIFDVNQHKKGFVPPREFLNNFGNLEIPELVYSGPYTMNLVNDVRNDIYGLSEGVVVKGISKTKGSDVVWMVKIKTQDWLRKVKLKLGDVALLEEVNGDRNLLV
jgi:hypothetical protein